jgi:3-methylcrotonyl-CoA carboxylase alpha subunit
VHNISKFKNGVVATVDQENSMRHILDAEQGVAGASRSVVTPMPCKIAQVLVQPGAKVKKGTPLVILEAMKMEHVLRAPEDAVVARVNFSVGAMAEEGKTVVVFENKESHK